MTSPFPLRSATPPAAPPMPHGVPAALLGDSAAIRDLRLRVQRIAPHLRLAIVQAVCQEGALAVARAIHEACEASAPFEVIGANSDLQEQWQIVEQWTRGTLVLAQIADLPATEQKLLVGALTRRSRRVFSAPHAGRILATLNRPPQALVATGQLLGDLYTRLAGAALQLPPLSERRDDLPWIAATVLAEVSTSPISFSPESLSLLRMHTWPGDLTELRRVISTAQAQSRSAIVSVEAVREALLARVVSTPQAVEEPERLQAVIERHVLSVLDRCAGNKVRASELLGISRSTLYRMLEGLTN